MCRARSAVRLLGKACSARMSSATTRSRQLPLSGGRAATLFVIAARGLKKVNSPTRQPPNCPIRSQCTRSSFRMVSRPARSPPSGRPALPSPRHEPRQTTSGATARSPSHPGADRDACPPRSGERPGCRSARPCARQVVGGISDDMEWNWATRCGAKQRRHCGSSRLGIIGQQHGRTPSQLRAGWPSGCREVGWGCHTNHFNRLPAKSEACLRFGFWWCGSITLESAWLASCQGVISIWRLQLPVAYMRLW